MDYFRPQKLNLVNGNRIGEGLPAMFVNFAGVGDVYGFDSSVVMGDDLALPVPIIDHRFENQDPLLCKVNPPDLLKSSSVLPANMLPATSIHPSFTCKSILSTPHIYYILNAEIKSENSGKRKEFDDKK